jgi:D-alanine transaminase
MPRFAYVNGRFVHHAAAAVHIEDRGYQFADGVYEVVTVLDGSFIDRQAHLERLDHSLHALQITPPVSQPVLKLLMQALVRRNGLKNGILYLQITRGVAPRDFKFPKAVKKSAIVMTTSRLSHAEPGKYDRGVRVVTIPDIRWARRDIKSTGLLAQVLAKQAAADAGAFEALMVDGDGFVTEGASSNAWILNGEGVLVTRQPDRSILHGVTGNTVERLAAELQIKVERRPFTCAEAQLAREAFLTSATNFCLPIVQIDDKPVSDGLPGQVTARLRALYLDYAKNRQGEAFGWGL